MTFAGQSGNRFEKKIEKIINFSEVICLPNDFCWSARQELLVLVNGELGRLGTNDCRGSINIVNTNINSKNDFRSST